MPRARSLRSSKPFLALERHRWAPLGPKNSVLLGLALATWLGPAAASLALAAPPPGIPIQGALANGSGGVAPDGAYGMTFRLYASKDATSPLAVDPQPAVEVHDGVFSTTLGAAVPLDTSLFETMQVGWIGIQVDTEPELPRIAVSLVPYAIHASVASELRCTGCVAAAELGEPCAEGQTLVRKNGAWACGDGLPTGMVAFFLGQCPAGWTEVTALRGRAVVGTPEGGLVGRTVGAPLADGGLRTIVDVPAHSHSADPAATSTDLAGTHQHTTDPAAFDTSTTGSHIHNIDPDSVTTSNNGIHSHTAYTTVHDTNSASSQGYPAGDNHNGFRTTDRERNRQLAFGALEASGAHTHSIDIPLFQSASSGAHFHGVDVPATTSSSAGAHAHSVDLPAFTTATTGSATVDVTMPYIQLTACQFQP